MDPDGIVVVGKRRRRRLKSPNVFGADTTFGWLAVQLVYCRIGWFTAASSTPSCLVNAARYIPRYYVVVLAGLFLAGVVLYAGQAERTIANVSSDDDDGVCSFGYNWTPSSDGGGKKKSPVSRSLFCDRERGKKTWAGSSPSYVPGNK